MAYQYFNSNPAGIFVGDCVIRAISKVMNTSTAIITVPRGCCFNMSVEYVSGIVNDPTATSTPSINVINANVVIIR